MFQRWRRRTAEGDAALIAASGLFDEGFYLRCNPDVAEAGFAPLVHFARDGWREGRRPNVLFDPAWYACAHGLGADENPLVHYIRRGEGAGLRPIAFFDPRRHARWHRLPRRTSALRHHLARRDASWSAPIPRGDDEEADAVGHEDVEAAAIAASGLFDANLYLVEAPDVRAAGWEALAHYRRWGWREGRRPNLYFDPAWYRARHLADAETDPLAHYLHGGEGQGLRPVAGFDPLWYARRYGVADGTSPLAHFLAHRRTQRVAPNPDFDIAFYRETRGADLGPNRDPFAHFLLASLTADIDPAPGFDAAAYRRAVMVEPPPDTVATGPAAWARAERRVPLLHFLDALP